jgi:hypothetical protein
MFYGCTIRNSCSDLTVLLIYGKLLDDCIISLRMEVWVQKTRLTAPPLIEVSWQDQKVSGHVFVYNGYRLYIFVRFFLLEFGCVPIVCYFLKYLFHFINKAKKYKSNTGTTYPSGAHEFTTGFQWGSCCSLYNVCGSSIYGFWLLLWYFQTLHS